MAMRKTNPLKTGIIVRGFYVEAVIFAKLPSEISKVRLMTAAACQAMSDHTVKR